MARASADTEVVSTAAKPLSERTDSMLAGTGGSDYPTPGQRHNTQILVCVVGTNDVLQGNSDVTFETDYKAEIDKWDAVVDYIILVTIAQRYSGDTKIDTSDIVAKNAIISGLDDYNMKISIVDVYSATTNNRGLIGVDGIHPSTEGQSYYGEQIADAIYSVKKKIA